MHEYFALAYIVSLALLLATPSKMSGIDNIGGSLIAAVFGPVLWPFYVAAFWKSRKSKKQF